MRSPTLLLSALFGAVAGCGSDVVGPDLPVALVKNNACTDATDQQGGGRLPGVRVRVTARVRKDGATIAGGLCDAIADETAPPLEFATPPGTTFDLFAEAFSVKDNTRIASGAILGQKPDKGAKKLPTLYLYDAQSSTCLPALRLAQPRAFHTATPLPNGQVLLVGGATPLPTPGEGPAVGDRFYLTGSVEVYDPATRSLVAPADASPVPRAFHTAALLNPTSATGPWRVLLVGGYSTDDNKTPSLTGNAFDAEFFNNNVLRVAPIATSKVKLAAAEILTWDPASRTLKREAAPAGLMLHSLAAQGGAALPSGGAVVAGGYATLGNTPTPDNHVDLTTDAQVAKGTTLPEPRLAPGVIVYPDGQRGMVVGGAADPGSKVFLRLLGLATPAPMVSPADASAMVPELQIPTMVLLDGGAGQTRFLVAGGLEFSQANFKSLNPPSIGPLIVSDGGSGPVVVQPAKLDALPLGCDATKAHYRPAAFDAATLLATRDRVIVSGGTARHAGGDSCEDCEGGDQSYLCALHQLVAIDVASSAVSPAGAAGAGLRVARWGHSQSLLPDGTVLVAGGFSHGGSGVTAPATLELFNPARKAQVKRAQDGVTYDADDPVLADLLALKWTREPGAPLVEAGTMRKHTCGVPKP